MLGGSFVGAIPVGAQPASVTMVDFATGSAFEDYLRVLQVAGIAPQYPWSIRGFSRREAARLVSADSVGPWALRDRFSGARIAAGPITLGLTHNSAYPYGANDGPVWAGRGLTGTVSAGLSGHAGPVTFTLAPIRFRAGNSSFELLENGETGNQALNHGMFASLIDLPQRFGVGAYSRLDPGSSSVRFESRLLTFGISTANEWIGPATEYPFLLGTNAAGFPHIFVGTGEPVGTWIGGIHARVLWGKLHQSRYSPVTGPERFLTDSLTGTVRLTTSGALVILPRGLQGLEIGVARFFHVPYRENEPSGSFWTKPLKVLFLENEFARGDSAGTDNQLVSLFFRWVLPRSGFEVFGERGYDDQFHDLRDFVQDPDHMREYMLGFQKVLRRGPGRMDVLKGELVNFQRATVARVREEGGVYLHTGLRQGHTNRGQLLGVGSGAGASAASTLSWTRYSSGNRTTATLRRIVRQQRGEYPTTGVVEVRGSDVIVAAGLERMRFGRNFEIVARLEAMQNYDRNFSRDIANLNSQLTVRFRP